MISVTLVIAEVQIATNDLSLIESFPSFPVAFFGNIAMNGVLLSLNEYMFFKYLKKVVFKKQLNINHDFVGIWLEITNVVLAFWLAVVHVHGSEFAKHLSPLSTESGLYPSIRYLSKYQ